MNQADVTKLVSKLRFAIKPKHRRLSTPDGPEGRLEKMRKTVTALIKYERIELNYPRADESRGYAERLISDAIRHGDTHKPTMEMADFFIIEKQYVHKLFKVLVPRLQNCPVSYTRMYKAPQPYPGENKMRAVLELRGHPFPALTPNLNLNRNLIQNVLLDEAKKAFGREKYAKIKENPSITDGDDDSSEKSPEALDSDRVVEKMTNEPDSSATSVKDISDEKK